MGRCARLSGGRRAENRATSATFDNASASASASTSASASAAAASASDRTAGMGSWQPPGSGIRCGIANEQMMQIRRRRNAHMKFNTNLKVKTTEGRDAM